MNRRLFITGTDTGVGKTQVARTLIRALVLSGVRVFPFKPVETGCAMKNEVLFPADGALLRESAGAVAPLDDVAPYRFALPLAPAVCAELEPRSVDVEDLKRRAEEASRRFDLVVIEGAGGLLVPLKQGLTFCDLARDLQAEVLVVVGSKLGCINHALLTFEVLKARGLPILGYVLNEPFSVQSEASGDLSIASNRQTIAKLASTAYDIREVGYLPYCSTQPEPALLLPLARRIVEHFGLKS